MNTNKVVVCIGLMLVMCNFYASADDCGEILAGGIHDAYNFSNTDSLESMTFQAVCAKKSSLRGSSAGFAFEFPIPELSSVIGLSSSNNYSRSKREEFCKKNINTVSTDSATNLAKKTINKDIVSAWSNCKSSGLKCIGKNINNSNFELNASWKTVAANVPEPVIVNDLKVVGGACDDLQYLRKNNTINENVPIVEVCTRNSDDSVFAYLNTSQGPLKCYVPKIVKVSKLMPSEYLAACADGNQDGCFGLQKQILNQNKKVMDYLTGWKPPAGPEQYRKERAIGNIQTSFNSTMNFIDDLSRLCSGYGATTKSCLNKRRDVSMRIDQFNSQSNAIIAGSY